jgi:tryptophan-rich sensory protein
MEGLLLLAVFIVFAFAIAHFLGRKRQIGFGWSFLFCLLFSPIFGFIITMLSRKYYEASPNPSTGKKIIGWVLIILFILPTIGAFLYLLKGGITDALSTGGVGYLIGRFSGIGFIALGIYLIQLGNGVNFNTSELTKID